MPALISIATDEDRGTWADMLRHSPRLKVTDYPRGNHTESIGGEGAQVHAAANSLGEH